MCVSGLEQNQLAKGNLIDVCDKIYDSNDELWYFIRIDGRIYGFVKAEFIQAK